MRLSMRLPRLNAHTIHTPHISRPFSCSSASFQDRARPAPASAQSTTTQLSSRWLSDLKAQAAKSSRSEQGQYVLDYLSKNWLDLLAGADGYLSGPRWTGLDNHKICWGDMVGFNGHVNNVVYNKFAESSRVNYFRNFSQAGDEEHKQAWDELMTPRAIGLILKSIKTDYKFPLVFPDTITVLHKLVSRPDTSSTNIDMEVVILSEKEQRPAARCVEDIVVYDYRLAKKAPLPPFLVEELAKAFDEQEAVKMKTIDKIHELQQSLA